MKLLTITALNLISLSAFALNCGDTITTEVKMTEDLDCSAHSGYSALSLRGEAILQGNGHRIITPNTTVGIYAEGDTIRIRNVKIEGSETAKAVEGYNVKKLILNKVIATDMYMGVDFYSEDDQSCDRLRVSNSDLSHNTYGARVNAPSCDYSPRFINSDFSYSKQVALSLSAKKIRILEKHNSIFDGSANGFNLKATEKVVIKDMDLSNAQIDGTQVFIYDTKLVRIVDSTLGNAAEGIHVYDAEEVIIKRSTILSAGVGIKIANDRKATKLLMRHTETEANNIGALVTSYGSTKFSEINIDDSNLFDYISVQNQ